MFTRRSLIGSFATLLVAPAIVRASSLMAVKAFADAPIDYGHIAFYPQFSTDTKAWMIAPAGEKIWAGDLVEMHPDGRVYALRPYGWCVGMAAAGSA